MADQHNNVPAGWEVVDDTTPATVVKVAPSAVSQNGVPDGWEVVDAAVAHPSTAPAQKNDKPVGLRHYDPNAGLLDSALNYVKDAADVGGAFTKGAVTGVLAGPKALYESVVHPIDTIKADSAAREELSNRATEDAKKGNYIRSTLHGVASDLPIVGPTLSSIADTGYNAAGGDPEQLGELVGMAVGPKVIERGVKVAPAAARTTARGATRAAGAALRYAEDNPGVVGSVVGGIAGHSNPIGTVFGAGIGHFAGPVVESIASKANDLVSDANKAVGGRGTQSLDRIMAESKNFGLSGDDAIDAVMRFKDDLLANGKRDFINKVKTGLRNGEYWDTKSVDPVTGKPHWTVEDMKNFQDSDHPIVGSDAPGQSDLLPKNTPQAQADINTLKDELLSAPTLKRELMSAPTLTQVVQQIPAEVTRIINDERGILQLDSPVRNPEFRAQVADNLKASAAQKFSPEIARDINTFIDNYPRLATHITDFDNTVENPLMVGKFDPVPNNSGRGSITINPAAPGAVLPLAHEGTHLAQSVRYADRSRRGVAKGRVVEGQAPFNTAYHDIMDALTNVYDGDRNEAYFYHPDEVAARVTEFLHDNPKLTREQATNMALNKYLSAQLADKSLPTARVAEYLRKLEAAGYDTNPKLEILSKAPDELTRQLLLRELAAQSGK